MKRTLNWLLVIEDAGIFTVYFWKEDQIFKYHLFFDNFDLIIPPLTMLQDVATLLASANTYKKGAKQLLQLEKRIFVTCFFS